MCAERNNAQAFASLYLDKCKTQGKKYTEHKTWVSFFVCFSLFQNIHPASYPMGTGGRGGGGGGDGGVNHSSQFTYGVNGESSCKATLPTSLHAVDRDNFTFSHNSFSKHFML
jgi:hypothetical protein